MSNGIKFIIDKTNKEFLRDISGAPCILNIKKIISRSSRKEFIDFVKSYENKIVTPQLEKGKLYTLKEQTDKIKWLFYIDDFTLVLPDTEKK